MNMEHTHTHNSDGKKFNKMNMASNSALTAAQSILPQ